MEKVVRFESSLKREVSDLSNKTLGNDEDFIIEKVGNERVQTQEGAVSNMEKVVEFESSLKRDVLDLFDKTLDNEDFIIEKVGKERVLTQEGETLSIKEFAGLRKGSEIFFKSDITSLIKLVKER